MARADTATAATSGKTGASLTIQRDELLRAVTATAAIARQKTTMPILANSLLACDAGRLHVSSTDLSVAVSASVPCDLAATGSFCVAGKTLFDVVKSLPVGEVKLTAADNAVTVKAGKTKFKLPTAPAAEYPTLPTPPAEGWMSFDGKELTRLVSTTAYAMSHDESRPHLNALLLEVGEHVRCVATDGHRLSMATYALPEQTASFSLLIPARGVGELQRLLGDEALEIVRQDRWVFFRSGDITAAGVAVEQNFPPYQKVIPKSAETSVSVDRHVVIDAIKRIALVAGENKTVILGAGEFGLRVRAENSERGDGSEEVECEVDGPEVTIGLSSRYLLDALQPLSEDQVRLEFGGGLEPAVIKPVGPSQFVGVVMPVRV